LQAETEAVQGFRGLEVLAIFQKYRMGFAEMQRGRGGDPTAEKAQFAVDRVLFLDAVDDELSSVLQLLAGEEEALLRLGPFS